MNSNIPDLIRDLPVICKKRPRFHKTRRLTEVTQSSWTNAPSPPLESPCVTSSGVTTVDPEPEVAPLSRLIRFQDPNTVEGSRGSMLQESFALEAESVKRTLIKKIVSMDSDKMDVELVIDLANAAFTSLSSFRANFGHLYDAVKVFISYHCKLAEAKNELMKNGCVHNMLVQKGDLAKKSSEAANLKKKTKIALGRSTTSVTTLLRQVEDTRLLLNRLSEKLTSESGKVRNLKLECDKSEKIYADSKAEYENMIRKIDEKKATEKNIVAKLDMAVARIESIKTTLSKLYWDELD